MKTVLLSMLIGSLTFALAPAPAQACPCQKGKSQAKNEAKKTPASATVVVLEVKGMTCGGCASKIAQALKELKGVYGADVSFEKNRATVKFQPKKITTAKLVQAVKKLGYQATVSGG